MPVSTEFTMPTTLEEAESRRQQLTLDVQSIQAQLGDKQRTDETGRRLTSKEYWTWKKRATHALNQRLDELRVVKQWIRDNRKSTPGHDATWHLRELHGILSRAVGQGLSLTEPEQQSLEAAGECLRRLDAQSAA